MQDSLSQWNNAAQWYDQNMGEKGDNLNAAIIRPVVLEMLGNVQNTSILDVGCGSGYLAAELAQKAKRVTGVDFAPNFISLCKQKYKNRTNMEFYIQDIGQPFNCDTESFDAIVCKMVLQYVPDIQPFATEVLRMMRPAGKLVIVIDHPFRAVYFSVLQNNSPHALQECFSDNPKTKIGLWGRTELTWYARTVSRYVNTFIDSGFRLIEMREPPAPADSPIPFSVLALKFIR